MESHSRAAVAQSTVWYRDHNMLTSPSWGSVARFDMPPQYLHCSAIYLADCLKVTDEPGLRLQTSICFKNLFVRLNKGRPNTAELAKKSDGWHALN